MRRRLLRIAALAVLTVGATAWFASAASAACSGLNQVTATVTPGPIVSAYDPFALGDSVRTMTLTVTNPSNALCDASVSFVRLAGTPPSMSSGGSTLTYDLTRSGAGSTIITGTGYTGNNTPPPANRIDFVNIPAQGSASADIELRIPQGQIVAAGAYLDDITLQIMRLNNTNPPRTNLLGRELPFTPQATVLSKCIMPSPSSPNLDLSSAISNGRPNEGVTRTTTFSNVQCTAPSKLRLTGSALQPTTAISARAGFDNFINYRANGTFGSATSTLTTTTSSQSVDSISKNVAGGATTGGQIDIEINLVDGQPIIAGSYTGILTVSIDPNY